MIISGSYGKDNYVSGSVLRLSAEVDFLAKMVRKKGRNEKNASALEMIRPTSFYASDSEKIKLNWFCYEFAMGIYDNMKNSIGHRLKRQRISDEKLAEFSIYYSKGMKNPHSALTE
jgi:hypothetical protein